MIYHDLKYNRKEEMERRDSDVWRIHKGEKDR
jgi:hypothetical protein